MTQRRNKKSTAQENISAIELDLLALFYTFADQYGTIDVDGCRQWAQEKLNVTIKDVPVIFEQHQIDLLSANNIVPDIGPILERMKGPVPPPRLKLPRPRD